MNMNHSISNINSLSTNLKYKAQQMYIIVWLKNDYGENKSSHEHLIKEFIDAL